MDILERDAAYLAQTMIDDLSKGFTEYNKIVNKVTETSQILETKGIPLLILWLTSKSKFSDNMSSEEKINRQILRTVSNVVSKDLFNGTDNDQGSFMKGQYSGDYYKLILLQKKLEMILNFALYKARALQKNSEEVK